MSINISNLTEDAGIEIDDALFEEAKRVVAQLGDLELRRESDVYFIHHNTYGHNVKLTKSRTLELALFDEAQITNLKNEIGVDASWDSAISIVAGVRKEDFILIDNDLPMLNSVVGGGIVGPSVPSYNPALKVLKHKLPTHDEEAVQSKKARSNLEETRGRTSVKIEGGYSRSLPVAATDSIFEKAQKVVRQFGEWELRKKDDLYLIRDTTFEFLEEDVVLTRERLEWLAELKQEEILEFKKKSDNIRDKKAAGEFVADIAGIEESFLVGFSYEPKVNVKKAIGKNQLPVLAPTTSSAVPRILPDKDIVVLSDSEDVRHVDVAPKNVSGVFRQNEINALLLFGYSLIVEGENLSFKDFKDYPVDNMIEKFSSGKILIWDNRTSHKYPITNRDWQFIVDLAKYYVVGQDSGDGVPKLLLGIKSDAGKSTIKEESQVGVAEEKEEEKIQRKIEEMFDNSRESEDNILTEWMQGYREFKADKRKKGIASSEFDIIDFIKGVRPYSIPLRSFAMTAPYFPPAPAPVPVPVPAPVLALARAPVPAPAQMPVVAPSVAPKTQHQKYNDLRYTMLFKPGPWSGVKNARKISFSGSGRDIMVNKDLYNRDDDKAVKDTEENQKVELLTNKEDKFKNLLELCSKIGLEVYRPKGRDRSKYLFIKAKGSNEKGAMIRAAEFSAAIGMVDDFTRECNSLSSVVKDALISEMAANITPIRFKEIVSSYNYNRDIFPDTCPTYKVVPLPTNSAVTLKAAAAGQARTGK